MKILAILMLLFSPALADEKHLPVATIIAGEQACIFDYQKLCTEVGFEPAAIHACFLAHKEKVSAACMEVVRHYKGTDK